MLLEALDGQLGNLLGRGLLGALLAGNDHVGLEHNAVKSNAVVAELLKDNLEGARGDLKAAVNVVVAIHQDLGLNNGHNAALLAQGRVAGQQEGIHADGTVGGDARANGDHSTPLGKASAELVVLLKGCVCVCVSERV